MYRLVIALCLFCFTYSYSQPAATTANLVEAGVNQKMSDEESSLVKNVPFKNIGPTIMSGRVTDLAVNPDNPTEFYVAYASGGLWHTKNNGTTFTPILDNAPTQNVGDIAVDWNNNTIWVGTGENNSSRSSYAGIGILKTTDNGKTWENMGLKDSHHIGRVLLNPDNPNEIVVGVTGHLYSENDERGIYKSTDGGKTWNRTLFIDSKTGIIDLQHQPDNYNTMYASSWTKDRKAWHFNGSGDGSAIYKSTDGGESWTNISTPDSGFPTGDGVGRIGIAVYDANTVYAIHDSQFRKEPSKDDNDSGGLSKANFKSMDAKTFLGLDNEKLDDFLKNNGFQKKYTAASVKNMVREGKVQPNDLAKYLEDANALLFDAPVIGAEVYRSEDGGKSWEKVNEDDLSSVYYSYGYYFGHIYVSPANKEHVYIYGVPILKSKDGGKTYQSIDGDNVHSDHHALWINPNNPNHLINGNDGGVNISYDDGENWIKNNTPSVGQFYYINVDNEDPYNVYGGLQDNGVWKGPHNAQENTRWHASGEYPWKAIMGGDGMQVQIDDRNSNIVYTGFQFGNYFRLDLENDKRVPIQPKHELGENPYRFNWQSPVYLSPHNQDIVYFGGNKLMRSMNQGDDWTAISPDLTTGGKKGNVPYGTITTISESPFEFGLIYVGTDDGNIQLTKDGGVNWQNLSASLPKDLWVSKVIASSHKKERVYITLNGYRWDDFTPYVYKSEDYGNTWQNISADIPTSPVNVIVEDPENEDLLFIGTDNGAYASFDRGMSWEAFSEGLPDVAVHDIKIQEREKDILLGTHGRSIYLADIEPLQNMSKDSFEEELVLFKLDDIRHSSMWGHSWGQWRDPFEPSLSIGYYLAKSGTKKLQIKSKSEIVVYTIDLEGDKGFNYKTYDLSISEQKAKEMMKERKELKLKQAPNGKYYLPKGIYIIESGGVKTQFEIK